MLLSVNLRPFRSAIYLDFKDIKKVLNAATMKLSASILSVVGAYYSLAVSPAFPPSVMWRFPAGEPATYTVFNAGFSMASVMLG
jgi:uncharacterized protein (DUF427 family)